MVAERFAVRDLHPAADQQSFSSDRVRSLAAAVMPEIITTVSLRSFGQECPRPQGYLGMLLGDMIFLVKSFTLRSSIQAPQCTRLRA